MSANIFSLELLQEKIGAEYIERNPVTGMPRIIQGLNPVWQLIEEHGGVSRVARLFGLTETVVFSWIDEHFIPMLYVGYLADPRDGLADIQLSSVGYQDQESGACFPWHWEFTREEFLAQCCVQDRKRA
jgi:hypothetical protein